MKKSVIVIGNGGSILNSGLGFKIDCFDEVIRINDSFTIGYEKDVGTKRTIWATHNPLKKMNKYIRHFNLMGLDRIALNETLNDLKEVWYVTPRTDNIRPWKYKSLNINRKIKRHESLEILNEIKKIHHHPSTGTILIYILLLTYDKIYTAGFDYNGRKKDINKTHYFADWKQEKIKELPHDLDLEFDWYNDKVNEGRVIDLTQDSKIIKYNIINEQTKKTCKKCGKESLYYSWENNICHYCESYL